MDQNNGRVILFGITLRDGERASGAAGFARPVEDLTLEPGRERRHITARDGGIADTLSVPVRSKRVQVRGLRRISGAPLTSVI